MGIRLGLVGLGSFGSAFVPCFKIRPLRVQGGPANWSAGMLVVLALLSTVSGTALCKEPAAGDSYPRAQSAPGTRPQSVRAESILFYASFSRQTRAEIAQTQPDIVLHNVQVAPNEGLGGDGALYLSDKGYAEIDNRNVNPQEGTICFWVRPAGDPAEKSHTYLSWAWKRGGNPDMVFSHGWWEGTGGRGRLYANMHNYIFGGPAAAEPDLAVGRWTHYAVAWENRPHAAGCLYENGRLVGRVAPEKARLPADAAIVSPIYLGSDAGSELGDGRRANAYVNHLTIYSRCLTADEVKQVFLERAPRDVVERAADPDSWMCDAAALKPRDCRDEQGRLLESRAVFDEGSFYMTSRQEIDALVGRIRDAGFNVIITCVWHGRGAEYTTAAARMSSRYQQFLKEHPNYDPYAYFIGKAHEQGIQVHSWFCVFLDTPPKGEPSVFGDFSLGGEFFNGYDQRCREAIAKVIVDHARTYPVDGINLDYVRLGGGLLPKTPATVEDYRRFAGRELKADLGDRTRMAAFTSWAVDDTVRRVRMGTKTIRGGLVLSVDAVPELKREGLADNGRNPARWIDQGLIDVAYWMSYEPRLPVRRMEAVRRESAHPAGHVFLLGNYDDGERGIVSRDPSAVAKLIDYCRRKHSDGNGVALYIYSMLSDEQIKALRAGPFKELARPSWQANIRSPSSTRRE